MGYAFIDHTADVAAELTGASLPELFVSAAQALADTITDLAAVTVSVTQPITVESDTLEDLLVDWLNELLYRFEVRNMLTSTADVSIDGDDGCWHLRGSIAGEPFDPDRHVSRVLVKSATYHGLAVTRDGGTWRARIVLDI
jgi:SHS2 domain-containing protein